MYLCFRLIEVAVHHQRPGPPEISHKPIGRLVSHLAVEAETPILFILGVLGKLRQLSENNQLPTT
jgi:hypothetical protein